jgi:hypothetical protein
MIKMIPSVCRQASQIVSNIFIFISTKSFWKIWELTPMLPDINFYPCLSTTNKSISGMKKWEDTDQLNVYLTPFIIPTETNLVFEL